MTHFGRAARTIALAALLLPPTAGDAAAQAVRGRVLAAEGSAPVESALITLADSTGRTVARGSSDAAGAFFLTVARSGTHGIAASHVAFAVMESVPLVIGTEEEVNVELRLSRGVVVIEPLTVTTRRPDPRQAATYQGVLLRYNEFSMYGARRVVMRGEVEFTASGTAYQLLEQFPRLRGCTIVYYNGQLVPQPHVADMWLATPSGQFDAVEFYRRTVDAPEAYRHVPPDMINHTSCSVLALWANQEPRRAEAFSPRRQLITAVGLVVMLGVVMAVR